MCVKKKYWQAVKHGQIAAEVSVLFKCKMYNKLRVEVENGLLIRRRVLAVGWMRVFRYTNLLLSSGPSFFQTGKCWKVRVRFFLIPVRH